jgi:hypothetical protein
VAVALLGGLMVLRHKVPLPETDLSKEVVARAIGKTRQSDEVGKWLVVHVLSKECGCSAKVLDALLQHRANRDIVERIVLVSDEGAPSDVGGRVRGLGYRFVVASRDATVAQYGIQGAPSLAILSPANELRYLGGYSRRKRGPALEDRDIIRRTLDGEVVPALPTFGCAVGRRLEARVNPLGL